MTDKCIERILRLRGTDDFEDLSIEASLLECIEDVGLEDVKCVLDVTDWDKELKRFARVKAGQTKG